MGKRHLALCMALALTISSACPGGIVLAEEVTGTAAGSVGEMIAGETSAAVEAVPQENQKGQGKEGASEGSVAQDEAVMRDASDDVRDTAVEDTDSADEILDEEYGDTDSDEGMDDASVVSADEEQLTIEDIEAVSTPMVAAADESDIEYGFWGTEELLLGTESGIDPTIYVYPAGEEDADPVGSVDVLSFRINDPDHCLEFEEDADGFVEYNAEDKCYYYTAVAVGRATAMVEYRKYGTENETGIYEYTITVSAYELNSVSSDGNSNGYSVLAGQRLVRDTELLSAVLDEDTEEYEELSIEEYRLEIDGLSEGDASAGSLAVDPTDSTRLIVTGRTPGKSSYHLKAYLVGGETPVWEGDIWIYVLGDMFSYVLKPLPEEVEEVLPGEALSLTPELYRSYIDENGELQEEADTETEVLYKWEYDPDEWHEQDGTEWDELPTLIRDTEQATQVYLYAVPADRLSELNDETSYGDIALAEQAYGFEETDLLDGFAFSENERGVLWTDGEPLTLKLVGVPESGYRVKWKVTFFDSLQEKPADEVEYYNWEANDTSITLQPADASEIWRYGEMLIVKADLCAAKTGECVAEAEETVSLYSGKLVPVTPRQTLLEGTRWYICGLSGLVDVYVIDGNTGKSEEHTVLCTSLTSSNSMVAQGGTKQLGGRSVPILEAKSPGETTVVLSVQQAPGSDFNPPEKELRMYVTVTDEAAYSFSGESSLTGSHKEGTMLPGDTLQIRCPDVTCMYYDPISQRREERTLARSEYELTFSGYDEKLIRVSAGGTVTALKSPGETSIDVNMTLKSDPGKRICLDTWNIVITDVYYTIGLNDHAIVDLSTKGRTEIPLTTTRYSESEPSGTVVPDVTYRIEENRYPERLKAEIRNNPATLCLERLNGNGGDDGYVEVTAYEDGQELTSVDLSVITCAHDIVTYDERQASCTSYGWQRDGCTKCGWGSETIIPAKGHQIRKWKTVTPATLTAPRTERGICTVCGKSVTRSYGTPQTPFIRLNAKSLPLKVKQSTKAVKVEMARGDSIVSWTSSNKKVATVSASGKIKGKKTGTATITVTLASGKKASVKIKVQKKTVRTKKIKGVAKQLKLAKGRKAKLKPVLNPLTSVDKIKYTSSDKSVATVDKKGNIKAKKKGTARITVQSGKKKVVCKVTVK